jgi:glycosyltransferase involved in cell wall biosynthesis
MLARERPSIVVDFFGATMGAMKVPYQYTDHGVLSDPQLAELYRGCTIGMVFSATNYSLIPHEMMACGLPVVDLMSPSTAGEFPLDAITLCEPTPEAIARDIARLLADDALLGRQRERAFLYVRQLSWEKSARQIERALLDGIAARVPRLEITETPRAVTPLRPFHGPVIFAGQPEYYRSVHYDATSGGGHFAFPFTSADPSRLRELPEFAKASGARTCIIFRPEWLCPYPETFAELKAQGVSVIGYSTEPVPQSWPTAHSDQLRRLETLKKALRLDYDLLIHFDSTSLGFLTSLGFGRIIAHPLPVSRGLFFPEDCARDFDVCFLGKSTPHREAMLAPLKMRFEVIHVAHGLRDEDARVLMNRSKLVLNLHNEAYPNFENRVVQALFCARPVVSETLTGDNLVAGRDYTPADSPEALFRVIRELLDAPEAQPPEIQTDRFTIHALLERLGIGVHG